MSRKARQYKTTTLRKLDTLSSNQCTAPSCNNPLIAKDKETNLSKICHIEAVSPGGARFNPDMTDDDRRHYNNLILLCDECHRIIDNPINELNYTVGLLKEWKKEHELKRLTTFNSNISLLKPIIKAISNLSLDEVKNLDDTTLVFNIQHKIDYNSIIRNKFLIENYKIYYTKINTLYNELEKQGSFKQENFLRNIRNMYLKIKGKYVNNESNPLKIIQENSDNIIEDLEQELIDCCVSYNTESEIYHEDILFGVSVIIVDAFMRCKIMECPV
ncbi:MAG: hypothetical protein HRU35_06825 [Rickettsiaceae bacterium]|nr:hypothetical protein [Rickettsiaceae bacterium]